jgi:hypothetical protein
MVGPFDPEGRSMLELQLSCPNLTLARPIRQDCVIGVKANLFLTAGSSQQSAISRTQPVVYIGLVKSYCKINSLSKRNLDFWLLIDLIFSQNMEISNYHTGLMIRLFPSTGSVLICPFFHTFYYFF